MSKREQSKAIEFPVTFHALVKKVAEHKPFGKEAMASIIQLAVLMKFEDWKRDGILPPHCKLHASLASQPVKERD